MLININFDLQDTIDEFDLDQSQVDKMCNAASQAVTIEIHRNWVEAAKSSLKSTRNDYIKSLVVQSEGNGTNSVTLLGSFNNKLESGSESWDMKCIVNPQTLIYTSKGFKRIKDIKIGDLVLSHKGKFQRVSQIFKEYNEHEYVYKITPIYQNNDLRKELYVTPNHPILTNKGWLRADKLDENKHKILTLANFCNNCGKPTSRQFCDDVRKNKFYCSRSCSSNVVNEFRRLKGRPDLDSKALRNISLKMIETNQLLLDKGLHVTQTGKLKDWVDNNVKGNSNWGFGKLNKQEMSVLQKKAAKGWGKKNKFSDPESKLWELIKHIPGIDRQYAFERNIWNDNVKRNRIYYFDFAIPEHKICIEVNGEYWHTKEQNEAKKIEVESHGWRYISFWSKEIYSNINKCYDEIIRILDNHNENYCFLFNNFKIDKIKVSEDKGYSFLYKYNLTVEDDSSYIAAGIVTHNSGFSQSPKAKHDNKGNWYLTIPFRYATPDAIGESEVFSGVLPQEIYDLIKTKEPQITNIDGQQIQAGESLSHDEIPEEFRTPFTRESLIIESIGKVFEQYVSVSSQYEGLMRSEKTYASGTQSTYGTMRRVSNNSNPNSWIHPPILANNFSQRALSETDTQTIVDNTVDKILSEYGF